MSNAAINGAGYEPVDHYTTVVPSDQQQQQQQHSYAAVVSAGGGQHSNVTSCATAGESGFVSVTVDGAAAAAGPEGGAASAASPEARDAMSESAANQGESRTVAATTPPHRR